MAHCLLLPGTQHPFRWPPFCLLLLQKARKVHHKHTSSVIPLLINLVAPHGLQSDKSLAPCLACKPWTVLTSLKRPITEIRPSVLASSVVTNTTSPCLARSPHPFTQLTRLLFTQVWNNLLSNAFHDFSPLSNQPVPLLSSLCASCVILPLRLSHCVATLQGAHKTGNRRVQGLLLSRSSAGCLASSTQHFWGADLH